MASGEWISERQFATRHSSFAHICPLSSVLRRLTGGARRNRTDDLMLAKHALSQLSYSPVADICSLSSVLRPPTWWAWEDLNLRPHAYQARALTN
jgi:hypothetical protein